MPTFDHILFPTDFSDTARRALSYASFLASHHEATLHILHVESIPTAPSARRSHPETDVELDECARRASEQFEVDASTLDTSQLVRATRAGPSVRDVVVSYATEHDVDLIAMGTARRRGLASLVPQSTAADVVRHAPCPVLTVLDDVDADPGPIRRILVPYDFSDPAAQALHTAHDLAALYGATVLPVHVIEELTLPLVYEVESIDVDTEDVRRRATSALQDVSGSQEVRVVSGHPARRLVHIAEDERADLIVIATHGRTGLSRVLLGSVAEAVIRRAPCPVYTVRATPDDALDDATA